MGGASSPLAAVNPCRNKVHVPFTRTSLKFGYDGITIGASHCVMMLIGVTSHDVFFILLINNV